MNIYTYSNKRLTSLDKSMASIKIKGDSFNKEFVIVVSGQQQVVKMELLGIQCALALLPKDTTYVNIDASQTTIDYLEVNDAGDWVKEPKNNIDLVEKIRSLLNSFGFSISRVNSKSVDKMKLFSDPYMTKLENLIKEN